LKQAFYALSFFRVTPARATTERAQQLWPGRPIALVRCFSILILSYLWTISTFCSCHGACPSWHVGVAAALRKDRVVSVLDAHKHALNTVL
jgi:hypothetical protein